LRVPEPALASSQSDPIAAKVDEAVLRMRAHFAASLGRTKRMTPGRWINFVAAALGAIGAIILFFTLEHALTGLQRELAGQGA
jgi:hypothetical protein